MPSFKDVQESELAEIQELRNRRGVAASELLSDLTGLCFSGGGIRSATFCLGILQGLATYRLLRRFDYISSVSGGGYISSWLVSWIKRPGEAARNSSGIDYVEKALRETPPHLKDTVPSSPEKPYREHGAIDFLRDYSNYLTRALASLEPIPGSQSRPTCAICC
jgi:predicted acylesterase/phospholipase RssA